MKTDNDYFRDWENHVFGFGYGSGEPHVLPVLRRFFEACHPLPPSGAYDFQVLERKLTPAPAWLLINTLCHADIIEYGTSPRFGWLTDEGKRLQAYLAAKTDAELIELVCSRTEDDAPCYPDHCNCEREQCHNPFWVNRR